jgi:hypothetical protein
MTYARPPGASPTPTYIPSLGRGEAVAHSPRQRIKGWAWKGFQPFQGAGARTGSLPWSKGLAGAASQPEPCTGWPASGRRVEVCFCVWLNRQRHDAVSNDPESPGWRKRDSFGGGGSLGWVAGRVMAHFGTRKVVLGTERGRGTLPCCESKDQQSTGCSGRGSNPHTLRRQNLNLVCLPFHHPSVPVRPDLSGRRRWQALRRAGRVANPSSRRARWRSRPPR